MLRSEMYGILERNPVGRTPGQGGVFPGPPSGGPPMGPIGGGGGWVAARPRAGLMDVVWR